MLNVKSMSERAQHLRERIDDLKQFQALSREAYLADRTVQTAVERHFQVAIECCLDMAKHIIAGKGLARPTDLKDVFQVLVKHDLLEQKFADQLSELAGLRNRLVHFYMTVEPDKMYMYLQQDIPLLERFAAFIAGLIEAESEAPSTE